jgi:hypothetical protein
MLLLIDTKKFFSYLSEFFAAVYPPLGPMVQHDAENAEDEEEKIEARQNKTRDVSKNKDSSVILVFQLLYAHDLDCHLSRSIELSSNLTAHSLIIVSRVSSFQRLNGGL